MNAPLAYRLARRELRGGLRGFRIFLACLALGVMAIAAVGTIRASIQAGLADEGAALLGGDAVVTFTYRFAKPDEAAWMNRISEAVSETVDFRSMAVVPGDDPERGLTQVQAVDALYPLIGTVQLDPDMPLDQAFAGTDRLPGAVIERILADRLALAPGDTFRLGTQDFVLSAILESYPDNSGGSFGLGPRTLVQLDDLSDSGLLGEGTLMDSNYRLDLPEGADLAALQSEAEARFSDSGLRWRDARDGAPGVSEFVDRIGAFLVLVGLSGLAVGGVGVSAAVRAYLAGKTEVIATLKTLGATRGTIFLTYFLQIGILTVLGVGIGLIMGALVPLALSPLIAERLPIPARFTLYPAPLAEAALYGVLTAGIFTLWPLARTEQLRAATLFRDIGDGAAHLPALRYLLAIGLLLAALVGAAVWFSGTALLTLWTTGGIAAALGLLVLAALGVGWLARRFRRAARGRPTLRLALGAIGAQRGETTSVVLSLGLGLTVLAAVGQIDGNLRRSISDELPEVAPSYFFVDIQPDQIDGVRARLEEDPAVRDYEAAPMLRGIITRINDQPAAEVTDHWVLEGDRGLTYSAEPRPGTVVTDGKWWAPDHDGPPQISFSREEAEEMGLSLGDTLTVNILGRDITAEITSFRQVDFDDAGMGFILSMNPAALQGAPHSWISTVYAEPQAEAAILRDLSQAYPNITAIRIRDAIDRVLVVLGGIAAATRYGALATLVTGFLVLIGAAAAGERTRTYEAAVLKTLGAPRGRILRSFALRAALLGLSAALVALAAGMAGGWAVSTFVMETGFTPIWSNALAIVFGGVLTTLLAGLAFALRPLSAKPARVLRARE
ncbi:MAG: FtsX-like permease family protein [Salibaculum sp.]|uniref:ABC transporter permease n=1 Tax=Salibaculum sp. TaxID=2855480 RepID=UPI0028707281|nr:FtsX-like permease family protein [Salibaculum sp.]MDR9428863.1 FtsX-like permease family protein [Salibaculum sp.]